MIIIRESLSVFSLGKIVCAFRCVGLFMLFIRESLFIMFTKEIMFMLFKFTCKMYKSSINSFYIIFTLIYI